MSVTVLYFASLRDVAGRDSEQLPLPASLPELYMQLRERYRFPLPQEKLRVAVDGEFVAWDTPPRPGSVVAFIPPVSGG